MIKPLDPHELNRLLREAEAAHRAQKFGEAEKLYNGILEYEKSIPDAAPNDENAQRLRTSLTSVFGQAFNNLGLIRAKEGKTAQALDCFRTALDYTPGSVEALTNAARLSRAQGNHEKALAFSTEAIRIDPLFTPAVVQFGLAALETGRTAEALLHFEKAAAKGGKLPGFMMAHGRVLEAEGDLPSAKDKFIAAAAHPFAEIQARLLAGAVCQRLTQFEEAQAHFSRVLEKDPRNLIANSALGLLQLQLGQYEKAEKNFHAALAVNPSHLDTIGNYALLMYLTGRFEEALKVARELAVAPQANEAQRHAGALTQAGSLRRLGQPEDALEALEKLTQVSALARGDWAFHKERGLNLEALGRYGEAFTAISEGNALFQAAIDRTVPPEKETAGGLKAALAQDYSGLVDPGSGPAEAPAFIIGFQQSGHQVLTALLKGAKGLALAEGLGVFQALRLQLEKDGHACLDVISTVSDQVLEELRSEYRQAIKAHGGAHGRVLVDANPANLYELPLILKMFPRARFIYVFTHPLDACLHCHFKDLVPGRSTRIYGDLEAAADYCAGSALLWEKFKAQMTFAHLEVKAEDLLDRSEAEVNRVLDFIRGGSAHALPVTAEDIDGLNEIAFDQKTLSPPGRWKNYRERLAGIAKILHEACRRRGYETI